MFKFLTKYFSKSSKNIPKITSNPDMEFAFKMHGMVKAINNSSNEDKLKSLETLRNTGHISEAEYQKSKQDLLEISNH